MVLGTSDVRLIDMTRAFAAVANRGVAVMPYGIRKVVTADGRLLYQHEPTKSRVLVAPWVAAEMTDLLQSAVLTGTGRAAQIGRPVAGKTGTTTSNKDGWFIGFSSGLTTGVWMGRDDARPIAGLQGGTAPARAFHDFMSVAVAKRPVEQFETEVPMPDWQLRAGRGSLGRSKPGRIEPLVDENGNPLRASPRTDAAAPGTQLPPRQQGGQVDQHGSTRCFNRQRRRPPAQQPPPTSAATAAATAGRAAAAAEVSAPARSASAAARPVAAIACAASASPPNSSRFERLELGAVVEVDEMCATSCATTYRRAAGGARISRQL